MVRCDKLFVIVFLRYIQNVISKCKTVQEALEEIEKVKVRIEELTADQIERELFS